MCHLEWFSKLKSYTYTWRVVHTALLETEQLPISLEFVFLSFASILYVTLLFIILMARVSGNLLKNHHCARYLLVNQHCTSNNNCDRRAEAEVNWTGLTLIMFIVWLRLLTPAVGGR